MAAEPSGSQSGSGTANATGNASIQQRGRTLVLCFDGTAGQYDNDNSNVVKLFSFLTKDPNEQLCYYQAGVGTWFKPGIVSPLLHWFAVIMDLAIAWYLDEHVLDGYRFVMQNYRAGDRICLFGFSRGSYIARALAGMLHKIGLLPRDNDAQMPFAYKLYKREDKEGLILCEGFKRTYCQDVKIDFVGVWDTVASVGVIMGRSLPFTNSNSSIKTFRHALSLDEHRARFRPNLYHRNTPGTATAASELVAPEEPPAKPASARKSSAASSSGSSSSSESRSSTESPSSKAKGFVRRALSGKTHNEPEKGKSPKAAVEGSDDVLEVWFSGCHSDVGGGNVVNDAQSSLSDIPLRWMIREAAASGSGIRFDLEALSRANIKLGAEASEEEDNEDRVDAVQPIYDSLKRHPIWWILEIMPMTYVWQDAQGVWHKTWRWHLGKGRKIEEQNPNFHHTVKIRMESGLGYKPRAEWDKGSEIYVSELD